jgi:hypothetical protein
VITKRYAITVSPSLTPAEWFFHVRNIADAVYQLGYQMRDFADVSEASREAVLAAKKLSRFTGLICHLNKAVDPRELRFCVEEYFRVREYSYEVKDLELSILAPNESRVFKVSVAETKAGDMKHYYFEFEPSVSPAYWYFHARNIAELMARNGYEMRDFHDGFILDRRQVLRAKELNFFEGFIYGNVPIKQDNVRVLLNKYLSKHGLSIGAFDL